MTWNDYKEEFYELINSDSEFNRFKKLAAESGSLKQAKAAAGRLSYIVDKFIKDNGVEAGVAEDLINSLCFPALTASYREISNMTAEALNKQLQAVGFGFKSSPAEVDYDRINSLLTKEEVIETAEAITQSRIQNILENSINETIKNTAEFSKDAGVQSFVSRDPGTGCCDWCNGIAGRYVYGKESTDFWRVHPDCTCSFSFEPSRGKWQRISYTTNNGKINKNTENL